jgi:hypothetical protein
LVSLPEHSSAIAVVRGDGCSGPLHWEAALQASLR